jgi:hypothetical protein
MELVKGGGPQHQANCRMSHLLCDSRIWPLPNKNLNRRIFFLYLLSCRATPQLERIKVLTPIPFHAEHCQCWTRVFSDLLTIQQHHETPWPSPSRSLHAEAPGLHDGNGRLECMCQHGSKCHRNAMVIKVHGVRIAHCRRKTEENKRTDSTV